MKKSSRSITQLCTAFDYDKIKHELADVEKQETEPALYLDFAKAKQLGRRKRELETLIKRIEDTSQSVGYFAELFNSYEDDELDGFGDIETGLKDLQKQVNELFLQTLYSGKWDDCDCYLDIHAGAGGEEAQDWAEMLSRMYLRYANANGYEAYVVDKLAGDGAGVRSICLFVGGPHAYGNLINEKGVHRLVRISPYDANKRRHTSFASVDVSPIIEETDDVVIKPEELKIDTYRSGGAGGQHVNKTESAVRITHLPTGIVVQCQNERSQLQNKEFAMKMLKSKLLELKEQEKEEQRQQLKSGDKKIEWGSQIRSYVLHPYNMVKDHRTDYQTSNTGAVLDGDIEEFILQNLILKNKE